MPEERAQLWPWLPPQPGGKPLCWLVLKKKTNLKCIFLVCSQHNPPFRLWKESVDPQSEAISACPSRCCLQAQAFIVCCLDDCSTLATHPLPPALSPSLCLVVLSQERSGPSTLTAPIADKQRLDASAYNSVILSWSQPHKPYNPDEIGLALPHASPALSSL